MNVQSINSQKGVARLAAALMAPACALLWAGPGMAATTCLKGNSPNKLCLDLSSVPGTSVQPSQMATTTTYVKYTAAIRNLVAATSRTVSLTLTLNPAPPSDVSFTADSGLACTSIIGPDHTAIGVNCLADKLAGVDPLNVTLVAEAPRYPTTVTQVVNTGVIGWNGNTASTSKTVAVSTTAGDSYVPANQQVTLATSDSDDVTADSPLYGRITLPPQSMAYRATITIVGDAPADSNCVDGIYLSTSGGPFICRDAGSPRRAIRIDLGSAVFTAEGPAVFTEKWDTSIVPATQLPPTQAAPTGIPPFAMFSASLEQQGNATAAYDAVFAQCEIAGNAVLGAPCLTGVQQLANGDWQVDSLRTNDGAPLAKVRSTLAPLYAVLDFLVAPAEAQITLPTRPGIGYVQ